MTVVQIISVVSLDIDEREYDRDLGLHFNEILNKKKKK